LVVEQSFASIEHLQLWPLEMEGESQQAELKHLLQRRKNILLVDVPTRLGLLVPTLPYSCAVKSWHHFDRSAKLHCWLPLTKLDLVVESQTTQLEVRLPPPAAWLSFVYLRHPATAAATCQWADQSTQQIQMSGQLDHGKDDSPMRTQAAHPGLSWEQIEFANLQYEMQ
jgi:hypothetical protein